MLNYNLKAGISKTQSLYLTFVMACLFRASNASQKGAPRINQLEINHSK
jgi:hypothetical protein